MIEHIAPTPAGRVALTVAMMGCLVFPWLNPWAGGPSPVVLPTLVTLFCVGWISVLISTPNLSPVWIGVVLGLALFSGPPLVSGEFFAVVAALATVGLCMGIGVSARRVGGVVQCVAGAWVVASVLSSGIGLMQYFGISDNFSPWISPAKAGEAYGNLRQRNQFATLTNIGQAALFWFVATRRIPDKNTWVAMVAAALLAFGTAASGSRTGLLQLGLLGALLLLWRTMRHGRWAPSGGSPAVDGRFQTYKKNGSPDTTLAVTKVFTAAMGGYLLGATALPLLATFGGGQTGILARFSEDVPECASRLILWTNAIHLIAERPWFGWGWGELDYAHYTTLYPGKRFCDILDNAHSLPLHLAVELGLPIALLICGALGWAVWRGRPWRETEPTRQMAWIVLAMIMLHSMLEYPLWYGPFQAAFGVSVGLLWDESRRRGFFFRENSSINGAVGFFIAFILLVSICFATWDYRRISQIYLAPQARAAAYRDDTLEKIRESRLFRNQVRFAELTTTPLMRSNAEWTFKTAGDLLHFSPEPRIIEKVIESAVMLGRDEEAMFHLVRYRAAFPAEHARWRSLNVLSERGVN